MDATFAGDHDVDFIDDDRLDGAENFTCLAREQQVERLGRGNENLGRIAIDAVAFFGARVAGADGDLGNVEVDAFSSRCGAEAGDRGAKVAIDVDAEGFERGDIEDADGGFLFSLAFRESFKNGTRGEHQLIDRSQKCGKRFPRSGRGQQKRAFASGDRGPGQFLRTGRLGEALLEPHPRAEVEVVEGRGTGDGGHEMAKNGKSKRSRSIIAVVAGMDRRGIGLRRIRIIGKMERVQPTNARPRFGALLQ